MSKLKFKFLMVLLSLVLEIAVRTVLFNSVFQNLKRTFIKFQSTLVKLLVSQKVLYLVNMENLGRYFNFVTKVKIDHK